jgi:hypothetical protein
LIIACFAPARTYQLLSFRLAEKRMSARGMPWLAAMDAMRHDRGNTNFKSRKNAAGKIILWDWEAL